MPVLLLGIVAELLWQFVAEIVCELVLFPVLRGTGTLLLKVVSLGRIQASSWVSILVGGVTWGLVFFAWYHLHGWLG